MPKQWMSKGHDTHRQWVDAIMDESSDELNNWEKNFIDNMERILDRGLPLTQAQEESLERIYASKTK